VLRRAHQLASNLKAEFIVLYVETPRFTRGTRAMQESLTQNLLMAEDMGAELVHVMGKNIAEEILEVARSRNVTQIVIGKPLQKPLQNWRTTSLVDRIIQNSAGISVHVIPARVESDKEAPEDNQALSRMKSLAPFISMLLQILILTVVLKAIPWHIDPVNIVMIYLIPVLYAARYGMGPSLFVAFISMVVFNFLFIPPYYEITFYNIRYLVTDIIYLGIAAVTSNLGSQLKLQMEETKNRENRTRALYELSRQIAAVTNMDELVYRITEQVGNTVNGKTVIYLPDASNELQLEASNDEKSALTNDPFERKAALLAFTQNKMTGHGSSTLPSARGVYLPLQAEDEVLGVLGVELNADGAGLSLEQRNLLEALAGLSAIAIGRARLAHKAQEIITLQESERLHTALFNSISHDLRTPLASITGAASSLIEEGEVYSPQERKALLETIYTGANRMNRLVGNLLDMARLQSGLMKINTDWCEVEDLIGIVLGGNRNGQPRTFRTDVPADLPLLHVDLPLMEHVLSNLIDNAIKYSPPEEDIDIWARHLGDEIWIAVADRGPGIPPEDQEKVFDKFYRLHSPRHVSGTGLGLSIVKAIVEAHGGRVWCEGREGGGSVFILALPAQDFLSTMKTLEKETKIK
ncbi:MAG TPA: sensor histidine kinase KdpD, partial [Syntrophomonadaceae bacterium]|nr:sensor histidine kinase KdpD [Syntrophomonadaceae bacterium]